MKKYILAFDGGGTKTEVALIDIEGNILFNVIGNGSNHQGMSDDVFLSVIGGLYQDALNSTKLEPSDIDMIYLGLSGADLESDYKKLYDLCGRIFKTKFIIVNDAWIILRSGLKENYGAVAICGTGTNSAAVNKMGDKAILRSLGYTTGTFGGGLDIARDALHYAFRCEEKSYMYTRLYDEIPALLGKERLSDCVGLFYPKNLVNKYQLGSITALVFDLALGGDEVSRFILKKNGESVGYQTVGVIKRINCELNEIPVVVGGRVFSGISDAFIKAFENVLLKECPKAYVVKPRFKPVIGAYFLGLDELKIKQNEKIENNILKEVKL